MPWPTCLTAASRWGEGDDVGQADVGVESKPPALTRTACRSARPGGGDETPAKHCLGSMAGPAEVTPQEAVMHLSPADTEKLLLSVAGMVARDRLARGVRLNHTESVALLSTWVVERAREGALVADLMEDGRTVLTREQVMEGVPEMLADVQVEATFPDGRKLVTLHHPIA